MKIFSDKQVYPGHALRKAFAKNSGVAKRMGLPHTFATEITEFSEKKLSKSLWLARPKNST
jgi:hypothetical protein